VSAGVRSIFYVLISGVLGVVGQILLKQGLAANGPLSLGPDGLPGLFLSLVLNPLVVVGLAIYLVGTLFWLVALSRLDLSYAYPFASLNYILVLISAWFILGEVPSSTRLVGVALISLGVCAIARTPANSKARVRPVVATAPALGGTKR
jgi:multidrug transporter EmrE-like cation transporter